jgi:hypothetical protein
MCVGFPNCPEGQKRVGKNKIFQFSQSFYYLVYFPFQCSQFLSFVSSFSLAGNGHVYKALGISKHLPVKPLQS